MKIILIIVLIIQILTLIQINKILGSDDMYILPKDSYVVAAWVTAVEVQGYPIDKVPEYWGLRATVKEILKERGKIEA